MVARALPVAAVAALAPGNPTLALRFGAAVCALTFLISLSRVRVRAAEVCLFAYATLVTLSTVWTINQTSTGLSTANTAAALVIFLAVRTSGATRVGWRVIAGGLTIGCCHIVYRIFSDNQLARIELSPDAMGIRYGLEGVNANYLAYSMATGAAIAFLLAASLDRRRYMVVMFAVVALLWAGIVQTETRGASLGIALAVAWVVVTRMVRPVSSFPLKILMLSLVGLAVSIATGLFQSIVEPYVSPSLREQGDLNGRFAVWPTATEWWWTHFWFGSGAGTFPGVSNMNIAAHNVLLDVGAGVGMAGVILFGAILYHTLWKETTGLPARVLLVGAYTLVSAPPLLSGFWIESPVFWVGLGLMGALSESWQEPGGPSRASPSANPGSASSEPEILWHRRR